MYSRDDKRRIGKSEREGEGDLATSASRPRKHRSVYLKKIYLKYLLHGRAHSERYTNSQEIDCGRCIGCSNVHTYADLRA